MKLRNRAVFALIGLAAAAPAALAQSAPKWNPVTPAQGSVVPFADDSGTELMCYDDYRGRFVALSTGSWTWEWDPASSQWSQSTGTPGGFGYWGQCALVFDSSRARSVFLKAGKVSEWDGASWTEIAPSGGGPVGRLKAAYDSSRAQVVVVGFSDGYYGRVTWSSQPGATEWVPPRYETWIYDGAAQQWTQAAGSAGTPALVNDPNAPGMVYDAGRDRFVLVGAVAGSSSGYDTAVWEYDPNAQTWTQVSTGGGPQGRTGFAIAYFPDRAATVVFGGAWASPQPNSYGSLDDTWEWNGYGWTQVPPLRTRPGIRAGASMAYDSQRSLLLLFGGRSAWSADLAKIVEYNDLWSYGGVDVPPVLDPIGDRTVVAGQTLSFTIHGTDADGDPLSYSASGLPLGAAFNAQAATFRWTPGLSEVGQHPVTFAVSDGQAQDAQTITITVTQPVAVGGHGGGSHGGGVSGHHTLATAELVGAGSYPGRFCGAQDWYKVHLAAGDTITFTISFIDANGDLDLYLYDAQGNPLDSSATVNDYETITLTAPQDGFYFFQVVGYRGAKNRYDVTIQ
jgi:hypothetical protein